MLTLKKTVFFIIILLFSSNLPALPHFPPRGPHTFLFGPESYYVERSKKGGAKQRGWLNGVYLSYEHLRRSSLYFAVDYDVAYGRMSGHDAGHNKVKSWLLDENVEGKVGYTYGTKKWCRPYVTPFVGYGYFYQTNRYVNPSPIKVKFRDTFPFTTFGMLTGLTVNPRWKVGLQFQMKWMVEGRSKITGDDGFDSANLTMEEKWQYEVELPVDYRYCREKRSINFRITPFFRLRQYGGKPNYPFDFIETKYRNLGLRLLATYDF